MAKPIWKDGLKLLQETTEVLKPTTNTSSVWKEKKALGIMTETVVKFLIDSAPNWVCIPFGMDNNIEKLKEVLRDNPNEESHRIKCMPDFVAVNTKTKEVLLIDVKYRAFIDKREPGASLYGFSFRQIKDYLEFWNTTYLIIVHDYEPYFSVINVKDIEWHKHFHGRIFTKNQYNYLEQWNFKSIEKDIKYLFPELDDMTIKKAINMIPKSDK